MASRLFGNDNIDSLSKLYVEYNIQYPQKESSTRDQISYQIKLGLIKKKNGYVPGEY